MTSSHDSVHSRIAKIRYVVLKPVPAVSVEIDGVGFEVYGGEDWEQPEPAEIWARSHGFELALVKSVQSPKSWQGVLEIPFVEEPTEPYVPHVMVLDDKLGRDVVGIFPSLGFATRWSQEVRSQCRSLRTHKGPYQILNPAECPTRVFKDISAADVYVVLRPVSEQSDGRKYEVFGGDASWSSFEAAEKWASARGIERKFVLRLTGHESLDSDLRLPASAVTTKPHVVVLEDDKGLKAIGLFASKEHCVCWCTAFFRKEPRGYRQIHEVCDPKTQDPNLDRLQIVGEDRGQNWPHADKIQRVVQQR